MHSIRNFNKIMDTSRILISLAAIVYIFVTCPAASLSAEIQQPEEKEWSPPSAGPITTLPAPPLGKNKLLVQPFLFYNRTRGTFDDEGHYKSFKGGDRKSQWQQQLFMEYGLTDRLEIDGQAVFQENLRHEHGESAETSGFGDSYLFLHYCAVDEKDWIPSVCGLFQLKFPTGKYQKADVGKLGTDLMGATSGGGSYDHGYGIVLTKKIKPFAFHASAAYNFPLLTKVDGVKTEYGDYLLYDFAAEYFLPKGFNLLAELNGFSQGDKKEDGSYVPASDINSLTMNFGIGWSKDALQTLFAYQRTLAGTNADVNDSFVFTFIYTF